MVFALWGQWKPHFLFRGVTSCCVKSLPIAIYATCNSLLVTFKPSAKLHRKQSYLGHKINSVSVWLCHFLFHGVNLLCILCPVCTLLVLHRLSANVYLGNPNFLKLKIAQFAIWCGHLLFHDITYCCILNHLCNLLVMSRPSVKFPGNPRFLSPKKPHFLFYEANACYVTWLPVAF